MAGQLAHAGLQRAFTFHNEPGGAQQRVGDDQTDTAEEVEGGEPVKRGADKASALNVKAVDHCAHDDALAEGREQRAARKGVVPEFAVRRRGFEAELKGDAAKDEADQHRGEGNGERINNHRIGQRKRPEQARATEHQPGLVAVPDWRHAVDHHIALFRIAHEVKQQADAQIKAIHDDVHQRGKDDDGKPDN